MALLFIYGLLILACLTGIFGVFVAKEYIKKISSLSVSYVSFIVFIILLSSKNQNHNNILMIIISLIVIFAVNLLMGIGIVKNIARARKREG